MIEQTQGITVLLKVVVSERYIDSQPARSVKYQNYIVIGGTEDNNVERADQDCCTQILKPCQNRLYQGEQNDHPNENT